MWTDRKIHCIGVGNIIRLIWVILRVGIVCREWWSLWGIGRGSWRVRKSCWGI